ncbi:E3 ubiquitin-protein ligase RAD18-like [Ptychodera flava]|uniref:E3 ubiquitin-protein ligase RAD18-like n=1 Tax=Ptychodera flava TaxID=63121 RepID=UPI003969F2EC
MLTDANSSNPSDWPKELAELREIDSLLQCNICFSYIETAMILPTCSHNYCSLCIRKYLSYKSNCPTCNTPVLEPELRNNRVLDNLVKNFISVRKKLLKSVVANSESSKIEEETTNTRAEPSVTQAGEPIPSTSTAVREETGQTEVKDTDVICCNNTVSIGNSFKKVKSPTNAKKLQKNPSLQDFLQKSPESVRPGVADAGSDITMQEMTSSNLSVAAAQRNILKADCPVCGVSVPQQNINTHLDMCLAGSEKKESLRSSGKRKPLPKLVHTLMSDKDLRKKLKEYNLSVLGNRQALVKRLQEYTLLYNSQCDSENPKSVAAIVKEVENAEKTRTQLASTSKQSKLVFGKGESEEIIEKKKQEYAKEHSTQFQQLIEGIKMRRNKAKSQKTETAIKECESSTTPAASKSDTLQAEPSGATQMELASELPEKHQETASESENKTGPSVVSHVDSACVESTVAMETDQVAQIKPVDSGIDEKTTHSTPSSTEKGELTLPLGKKPFHNLGENVMNFTDSDSDFSTNAFPVAGSSSSSKSKGKTPARGKRRKKVFKEKLELPSNKDNSEIQEQQTEPAGPVIDSSEDSKESTPSPSIFEMATPLSSQSSGPLFGGPTDDEDTPDSPALTPSLGFAPTETTSQQSGCSDVMQKVHLTQLTPNSPVIEAPPRRTLRKRKNEQESTASGGDQPTSSNEFANTRRKRRRANKN